MCSKHLKVNYLIKSVLKEMGEIEDLSGKCFNEISTPQFEVLIFTHIDNKDEYQLRQVLKALVELKEGI